MRTLTRAWNLMRTVGVQAARGLAAVESMGVHRRAQHNAASAAALASADRREAEDVERWIAAHIGAHPADDAFTAALADARSEARRAHG